MKIGIFLGSFDPFHVGHYKVVNTTLLSGAVDKVIIVPAKHNPWKDEPHASLDERIEICKSYFKNPHVSKIVEISDIERNREDPVYSSDTLRDLKKAYPEDELLLIGGPDTFKDIEHWHEGEWIKRNFNFIDTSIRFGSISSTHIRELLKKDEAVSMDELGCNAYSYIKVHSLYGTTPFLPIVDVDQSKLIKPYKMNEEKHYDQIVTHFTDNDLYTFTCMYYILRMYGNAEVEYTFFDRSNRVYPEGFARHLNEQIKGMENVVATEEEIAFFKTCRWFSLWFCEFLRGYRFNSEGILFWQDDEGHLHGKIKLKWWEKITWEMPILGTISELYNIMTGNMEHYDREKEYAKSYMKMKRGIQEGLRISDMGTRRRFSFDHHEMVIQSFIQAQRDADPEAKGAFIGTSNVYFAMKYGLTPIGTMSHQIIAFEECVSGLYECNNRVMEQWAEVYDGDNGIYLYDCFGDDVFFKTVKGKNLHAFSGLRVDSGVNSEQAEKIIKAYEDHGIKAEARNVVFSNALTIDTAIDIHRYVHERLSDSYGMGTHLTGDVDGVIPANIVIKLTGMRLNSHSDWRPSVKLSCDKGKKLGDPVKCEYLTRQIEQLSYQ